MLGVLAVLVLITVIYAVMRSAVEPAYKTAAQKRREIIAGYEAEMRAKLEPLKENAKAMREEKVKLLKHFSEELAMNVLFDADEKRVIISDLARYDV